MERLRRPAAAGTAASLATALLVVLPYALPEATAEDVALYYQYGLVGGWSVCTLALVACVVFAAGWRGRTDPDSAAGAGLVLGLAATVLAVLWTLALPTEILVQMTTRSWFDYHPWLVVVGSVATTACAVWYASLLDLF